MPHIEEMDPELIAKLIEGMEDAVGPVVAAKDEVYAGKRCPRCSGQCRKKGGSLQELIDEFPPRFNLECLACGCEFSPASGVIYAMGNLAQAFERDVTLVRET